VTNDASPLPGFVEMLREIKAAYDGATDPHEKRRLWEIQIDAVMHLVDKFDTEKAGLTLPLRDLSLALLSLDSGATEPALQPRKTKGRPQSMRAAMFRGHAAAASTVLIRVGLAAPLADARVAARLDELGYRKELNGGGITGSTIKGWRKEAREALPSNPMRFAYDHLLQPDHLDALVACFADLFDWTAVPRRMVDWEVRGGLEHLAVLEILRFYFPPPGVAAISESFLPTKIRALSEK
jgi:hypothetical protein